MSSRWVHFKMLCSKDLQVFKNLEVLLEWCDILKCTRKITNEKTKFYFFTFHT